LTSDEVLELMDEVKKIHIESSVKEYIVRLIQYLRDSEYTLLGPSPRASIWTLKGSRAHAMLKGRDFVIPDDVKTMLRYVVPHRLGLTAEARIMETTLSSIIQGALDNIPVPKGLEQ
jgi:MoxR-like ATPase